jgi:methionyl-tRNA synthetase
VHTGITHEIFEKVERNGFIEKRTMSQFFCEKCKICLADRYVKGICAYCGAKTKGDQCDSCSMVFKNTATELKQPKCALCSQSPIIVESPHLFFTLTKSYTALTDWLINSPAMVPWSNNARTVTKGLLATGLQDRCITRDLSWGIPVPESSLAGGKVFYVWF